MIQGSSMPPKARKKPRSVRLDLSFQPRELREKKILQPLERHLMWHGARTFLANGQRDLNFIGELGERQLVQLRKLVRDMRTWEGMKAMRLRTRYR